MQTASLRGDVIERNNTIQYVGGIGCSVGWILAIVTSITASGSLVAIFWAVLAGPFFMWVEAIWWGEWLPVLLFYPSFGIYLMGTYIFGDSTRKNQGA